MSIGFQSKRSNWCHILSLALKCTVSHRGRRPTLSHHFHDSCVMRSRLRSGKPLFSLVPLRLSLRPRLVSTGIRDSPHLPHVALRGPQQNDVQPDGRYCEASAKAADPKLPSARHLALFMHEPPGATCAARTSRRIACSA
jgi:hypothetical protein